MQEGREKRERERNVSGTPDSKYPPDTLHLSLHVPSLGYLTTDASSCDRTEGRKRERSNDRSLGMPVVPIEKLLIRDSEEGAGREILALEEVNESTSSTKLGIRNLPPSSRFLNGATRLLPNIP